MADANVGHAVVDLQSDWMHYLSMSAMIH